MGWEVERGLEREVLSLLGERRVSIYMTKLWEHRNESIRMSHVGDGSDNLEGVFQCVHLKRCHDPVEVTNCCYTLQDWYFKTQTQICFKY